MKRILSLILASVMLVSCLCISSFADEPVVGDFNGDGKCNLADVSTLLKYVAKWDLGSERLERIVATGDLTHDGIINMADAAYYLKWIAKTTIKYVINPKEYSLYWDACKECRDQGLPEPTFEEWLADNGYDVESYHEYLRWIDENYYHSTGFGKWMTYTDWLPKYGNK